MTGTSFLSAFLGEGGQMSVYVCAKMPILTYLCAAVPKQAEPSPSCPTCSGSQEGCWTVPLIPHISLEFGSLATRLWVGMKKNPSRPYSCRLGCVFILCITQTIAIDGSSLTLSQGLEQNIWLLKTLNYLPAGEKKKDQYVISAQALCKGKEIIWSADSSVNQACPQEWERWKHINQNPGGNFPPNPKQGGQHDPEYLITSSAWKASWWVIETWML